MFLVQLLKYQKVMQLSNKDYSELSMIELNNKIISTKTNHEILKERILAEINEVEELEIKINDDLQKLRIYEDEYIKLIDELNNR